MNFFFGNRNHNTPNYNRNRSTGSTQQAFFAPEAMQDFTRQQEANGTQHEGGFAGFFDAFQMAAAQAASMNDVGTTQANMGAPPASRKAIRQLPTVVVTPE